MYGDQEVRICLLKSALRVLNIKPVFELAHWQAVFTMYLPENQFHWPLKFLSLKINQLNKKLHP